MAEILSEMFVDAVLFLWRMLRWAAVALGLFLVFQTLGFIGLGAVLFTWWWWWDSDREREAREAKERERNNQTWEREAGPFGDAGWAKKDEVQSTGLLTPSMKGVWLGNYVEMYGLREQRPEGQKELLAYCGENGLVTFGPPGTGKGTTAIITTLLTSKENMFVLDIKGQNYAVTHRWRRDGFGHKIILVDPLNRFKKKNPAQYNPLALLTVQGGKLPPEFSLRILALAASLIASRAKDPHWDDRARELLAGLIAYVCSTPGETATLPRVYDLLSLPSDTFQELLGHIFQTNRLPIVLNSLGWFVAKEGNNEAEGIKSTAKGQLGYLIDSRLRRFLSASSFSFEELRQPNATLYFVIPPKYLDTFPGLARFFIESFFTSTTREPTEADASILMILDEQAKLGYMKTLEDSVALVRGYKVRLWSIFQDLGQLQDLFPKRWSSILSCAGVQQYFTLNDATTAEYISKQIGNCTRDISSATTNEGRSTSRGDRSNNFSTSTTAGTSIGPQGVPFLRPQDFYGMDPSGALLWVRGLKYPIWAYRRSYRAIPQLKGRYDPDPFHGGPPIIPEEGYQEEEDIEPLPQNPEPPPAPVGLVVEVCPGCEKNIRLRKDQIGEVVQCPRADCGVEFVFNG